MVTYNKTDLWIWWSNLLDLYTTGYHSSQITIWHCHLLPTGQSTGIILTSNWNPLYSCQSQSQSQCQCQVTADGQSASRPVCLGVKYPSGTYDQIFITARELRVCWCGALSLMRERVCRLQLLLFLASAVILRVRVLWAPDQILLSKIRDYPNLEGQVPVFISHRNTVAQLIPQALGSLLPVFWLCPLITPRHGHHGKHRLILKRMHAYWSVT
jgi:hypothetical protein